MPATQDSLGDRTLGIGWQLTQLNGWGVFGLNLALELARRRSPAPLLLHPTAIMSTLGPWQARELDRLERTRIERSGDPLGAAARHGAGQLDAYHRARLGIEARSDGAMLPDVTLFALGNELGRQQVPETTSVGRSAGFVFLEKATLGGEALRRAGRYDRLIAGSTWNRDVLAAEGVEDVRCVFQGVDLSMFHPGPAPAARPDRFIVFSGGKLEYRKGQDIVVEAFRAFHQRHPDSLLVVAWNVHGWPAARSMAASPHGAGAPPAGPDGAPDVSAWIRAQRLPPGAVLDLRWISYHLLPDLLRGCDAAVFASRAEGGTNLFAMQAMACGVPTVLSANTGHLDLIADDRVYALRDQRPLEGRFGDPVSGWGESSVEELVEALEAIRSDREAARIRGLAGARFMADWSWASQTDALLAELSDLF